MEVGAAQLSVMLKDRTVLARSRALQRVLNESCADSPEQTKVKEESCDWDCDCTGSNAGFPFSDAPYSNSTLFPSNYGTECSPWEHKACSQMWPNSTLFGDWCCESWCYVGKKCPVAERSWTGEDLYFTWKTCENDPDVLDKCKYDCECTNSNEGFPFKNGLPYSDRTLFPDSYGKTCGAWEKDKCKEMWPDAPGSLGEWCVGF